MDIFVRQAINNKIKKRNMLEIINWSLKGQWRQIVRKKKKQNTKLMNREQCMYILIYKLNNKNEKKEENIMYSILLEIV